jgi:NAD(P)-dependent dehydrogenase (short-subunit alcohol dehydrogenase family)
MTQKRSLHGKVVAITGAARGIGKATAEAFASQGARVAIGDLDGDLAEATAAQLPGDTIGLPLDVTDRPGFTAFLDEVEKRLGPLDILVNNAGIMPTGLIEQEDDADTLRMLEINLHAVIHGTREAIRRMKPRGTGHIVNISSAAGKVAGARAATYSATKFAVSGFDEAVAQELHSTGVEISTIYPTLVNTELTHGLGTMRGMNRIEPQDVAAEIVKAAKSPRLEVPAPRSLGWLLGFNQALNWRVRLFLSRVIKADSVISKMDTSQREGYEARIRRHVAADDAVAESESREKEKAAK